jgi:hypothetical protein
VSSILAIFMTRTSVGKNMAICLDLQNRKPVATELQNRKPEATELQNRKPEATELQNRKPEATELQNRTTYVWQELCEHLN